MSGVSSLSNSQILAEIQKLMQELEGSDDSDGGSSGSNFQSQANNYGGGGAGGGDGVEHHHHHHHHHEAEGSGSSGGGGDSGASTTSSSASPSTTTTTTTTPSTSTTTTSSSSGAVAGASESDPATAIADNLEQTFGLTATQAAGVLGNLQQESGLQGDINQGGATGAPSSDNADDNENGWGLAQWGGARKEAEEAYASQHGESAGSMAANLGYMDQELEGSYSSTISAVKSTNTADGAALAWDEDYEEASNPDMSARDANAEQFQSEGL